MPYPACEGDLAISEFQVVDLEVRSPVEGGQWNLSPACRRQTAQPGHEPAEEDPPGKRNWERAAGLTVGERRRLRVSGDSGAVIAGCDRPTAVGRRKTPNGRDAILQNEAARPGRHQIISDFILKISSLEISFSVALSVAVAVKGYEPDPVALESGAEGEGGRGRTAADQRSAASASQSRALCANFGEGSHHCRCE